MVPVFLVGVLLASIPSLAFVEARQAFRSQQNLIVPHCAFVSNVTHSLNVSTCPGMFFRLQSAYEL